MTAGRSLLNERVSDALMRIRGIQSEETVPEPFRDYFRQTAEMLISAGGICGDFHSFCREGSYADPDFAAGKLGTVYGPLLSSVYAELLGIFSAVQRGDAENRAILYELFLLMYFEFENESLPKPGTVRDIFGSYLRDYLPFYTGRRAAEETDGTEPSALFTGLESEFMNRMDCPAGTAAYPQFESYHSGDLSLVMDDAFVSLWKRSYREAFEKMREKIRDRRKEETFSLPGENPPLPKPKDSAIQMTEKQAEKSRELLAALAEIRKRYIGR